MTLNKISYNKGHNEIHFNFIIRYCKSFENELINMIYFIIYSPGA